MLNYRRSLMMTQINDVEILGASWQDSNPTILSPKEIYSVNNLSVTTNSKTFILEGITLRGVNDIKDRIYTEQGKVYLERKLGLFETLSTDTVTLNGGALKSNGYGQFYFSRLITDENEKGVGILNALNIGLCTCNTYNANKAYYSGNGDFTGLSATRIWFCTNAFEDTSEFDEWLKFNSIKFIYVLAIPVTTEITGELAENILSLISETTVTLSDNNAKLKYI